MSNIGFKGIACRQTGTALLFDAFLQTAASALVTAGTTNLYIWEVQSDGTIKTYDFSTNTFKTTTVTTEAQTMGYQKSNNGATDTGYWTFALTTLTGFTVGANYRFRVNNVGANPTDQVSGFVYGSAEGDLTTTVSTTGVAAIQADARQWVGATIPTPAVTGVPKVDAEYWVGNGIPATNQNGVPKVDLTYIVGSSAGGTFVNSGSNVALYVDVRAWQGTQPIPTPNVTGVPIVDWKYILGSVITGTAANIAAAWSKAWNVVSSVWTSADANQTGDAFGVVSNVTYGNAAIEEYASAAASSAATAATEATAAANQTTSQAIAAALASNNLSILSPVIQGGIQIVEKDSYLVADGRQIVFTAPIGANWPASLAGWTITFSASKSVNNTNTGTTPITTAGAVDVATGPGQEVHVELASSLTTGLAPGVGNAGYDFDVVATNGSSRATLIKGQMTVLTNITA